MKDRPKAATVLARQCALVADLPGPAAAADPADGAGNDDPRRSGRLRPSGSWRNCEHDPRLDYARALLEQAGGTTTGALKLFDAVTNSRVPVGSCAGGGSCDRIAAVDGRTGRQGRGGCAGGSGYMRGAAARRELALRLRIAELRRKTGQWRAVFAQLRAVKKDFPAQADEIDRQLKEAFAAVPKDPALDTMPATDLIAMLEENAELMADGPDGEPMRVLLAQKLMALDLPKRADPVLAKLMRAAPFGPARAGFGATLATVRLHEERRRRRAAGIERVELRRHARQRARTPRADHGAGGSEARPHRQRGGRSRQQRQSGGG